MQVGSPFAEAIAAFQRGELDRARTLAEQELDQESGSAPAQHLLGLIDCRTGHLESGVERLRRASEAEPGNIAFRVMLMRALVDSGRAGEALALPAPDSATELSTLALWHARAEAADAAGDPAIAEKAWRIIASARPADWRAVSNHGNALAAQGRWAEAGEALSSAAALNPSDLLIRRNAGSALVQADRFAEALDHFIAVGKADPKDVENRVLLGRALARLQRYDESIAEFEAAKAEVGETAAIELGLGRCHFAKMRFAEAEAALRRALAIDPTDRAIVHQLGLVLERTNQLEALSKLLNDAFAVGHGRDRLSYFWAVLARREGRLDEARELLIESDPSDDPKAWYRLKAKIADELGNSDDAFEAATAMNLAARDHAMSVTDFDASQRKASAYRDGLRQLARTITPEWAARVPLLSEPTPRAIAFLVGFPRSGTTLLDTFLMGHPKVVVIEEEQLVGKARQVVGDIKDLPGISRQLLEKARETYLDALAERVCADFAGVVVDKFPLDMAMAPLIQAMFPGAPIIFAQRHPCDVVLSGFVQGFGLDDFADIRELAEYYDAMMGIWTNSRELMSLNAHTVVYEDLVRDPETTLKPLLQFLRLDWDDRLLDHRATARARGAIVTPSYDQVTEPLSKAPSGRWRRYEEQLAPVLPVLLPWAERLGYRI